MGVQALTEKEFQKQVLAYAALRGWKTAHFGNTVKIVRRGADYRTIADRGAAGFPDLVILRPPRLLFAELKAEKGRLTKEQADWLAGLGESGQEVHCWRPSDWETIEQVLA